MMARWSYLQGNGCFGALRLLQWRHKAHAQGPRHQATCMYDENLTVKQSIYPFHTPNCGMLESASVLEYSDCLYPPGCILYGFLHYLLLHGPIG